MIASPHTSENWQLKTPKLQGKQKCATNKQTKERKANIQARSLARVMAFFRTVFLSSMNLRTTQRI